MKIRTEKVIDCNDWDKLVKETYGKPYTLQQQRGCHDRGFFRFTVPEETDEDDYAHDEIPEVVNDEKMCVKFDKWLARDPKQELNAEDGSCRKEDWAIDLWWSRNFYPAFQVVANDLHKRGKIEAGDYTIDINW
jgi:hypothetical protein